MGLSYGILPRSPLSGVSAIRGKIMKHRDNSRAHYEALLPRRGVTSSNVPHGGHQLHVICNLSSSLSPSRSIAHSLFCRYRVRSTRLCNNAEVISSRTATLDFAFLSWLMNRIQSRFSPFKTSKQIRILLCNLIINMCLK